MNYVSTIVRKIHCSAFSNVQQTIKCVSEIVFAQKATVLMVSALKKYSPKYKSQTNLIRNLFKDVHVNLVVSMDVRAAKILSVIQGNKAF